MKKQAEDAGEMEGLQELCGQLTQVLEGSGLVRDEACLVHGDYKVGGP